MRNKKVLAVMISLMVLSGAGFAGTAVYANIHSNNSMPQMQGMPGGASSSDTNTPPSMPGGNSNSSNSQTPPAKPDGDTTTNQNGTPPSMPNDGNNSSSDSNTLPSLPGNGSTSNDSTTGESNSSSDTGSSAIPGGNGPTGQMPGSMSASLSTVEIIIMSGCALVFSAAGMYLILSHGAKKTLKETFPKGTKIIVYTVSTALLTGALSFGGVYGVNHYMLGNNSQPQMGQMNSSSVNLTAVKTVTSDETESNQTIESTESDVSSVLVNNGGSYTLSGSTLSKTGDTSNTESSEFNGLNAAAVVTEGQLTISDTTINTSAKGANALFATGENAEIEADGVTITTTGDSSRGLDATYGGTIKATNMTITTSGAHCATLATDRGEGTVTVSDSKLTTNGSGSPIIYSTGNITLTNSTGTANGSAAVVIEGKNSATIDSTTITTSGQGRTDDGIDNAGVMIYQSTSGDASEGTGTFTATDSTITIDSNSSVYTKAPMFFITNTDAVINLTNTKLSYGSGVLVKATGNDEWGTSGSNGGTVTLTATDQTLEGDIVTDALSSVSLTLKKSALTGTINGDNATAGITVELDGDSTWNVTGDSYVTTLTLANNDTSLIKSNGHTIYYDASANSWLNGKTVTLSDGGTLTPAS